MYAFYSCAEKKTKLDNNKCAISISELMENDSSRLQVNYRSKNGAILQLVDKTNDSITAGAYYFYPDGSLQSYKFFSLPSTYQYNLEYDSLGNVILIEGSPLVLRAYRQIDSSIIRFTFFFSTLQTKYQDVRIKTNTGIQFNAELLPNAVFTNIKSVTFDLPVAKTLRNTLIYTNCQIYNFCLDKQWTLLDTAAFNDVVK